MDCPSPWRSGWVPEVYPSSPLFCAKVFDRLKLGPDFLDGSLDGRGLLNRDSAVVALVLFYQVGGGGYARFL